MPGPTIAIGPDPDEWAVDAVRRGGGVAVDAVQGADALAWLSTRDIDGLRSALATEPGLRWVQLPFAGVEPFVEAGLLDDRRVWTCAKGSYAEPVAEHALALALAGLRCLPERIAARSWGQEAGTSLYDARVVILGGGGITVELLRLLAPLRVEATVVRRQPEPLPGATRTVATEGLLDVLPGALVVFVALALTPATTRIIGRDALAAMDATAWLVNVARGRHVDTGALVEALSAGAIAGAALDVTDPQPLPDGHPLWALPNCIITPYTADTWEMVQPRLAARIEENVARFATGEPLVGLVDPTAGYDEQRRVAAPAWEEYWEEYCEECGRTWPVPVPLWRCPCGGLLGLRGPVAADPVVADRSRWSLWRYEPALPALPAWPTVTLGEGMTPLVAASDGCWWKLDFLNPTLSFKDRGAALVLAAAASLGVDRVLTDSSGNAGTAVAAYAARAGLPAEVWVPAGTSPKKLAAMEAHGASVRVADGDRAAAAAEARRRADEPGVFYASHVYQPLFAAGVKTVAFEVWEQLGRSAPEVVVVPAGNGTLVLGAAAGFGELAAAGLIPAVPRIVAVQAAACAPLAGRAPAGPTVAEGIAIAEPPRRREILAALDACGGEVVVVDDTAILAARADLAHRGVWVEPTAAAAWAAWLDPALPAKSPATVVVLCGAGLKMG